MTRTCPQHFSADDVVPRYAIDGLWEFTCDRSDHQPPGPYAWMDTNDAGASTGGGGPSTRSLDPLTGALLRCLQGGDPWVEYGVVEWRFRAVAPELFAELVAEHGHIALNPRATRGWTASAYLVHSLGELRRAGQAARVFGHATGPWGRQPEVSYWAVPPVPADADRVSWAAFAVREGLSEDLA